jgi:hypothetical protein
LLALGSKALSDRLDGLFQNFDLTHHKNPHLSR